MSNIAKAIELASTLAQQQMNELDAEVLGELLELYQTAADLIAESVQQAALGGNAVRIEQLAGLREAVEQHLAWLNAQRQALLNANLPKAAELGSRPFAPALELNTLSRINHDAVRFVREFQAADGLQLSDRIWRINRAAREKLINEIELAVVQGHSANQAARAMLARGENPDVVGLDAAEPGKIARASRDILTGEGGSAYYNAARVFRTELNRAHGTAYLRSAEQTPGCIGTQFLLSRAHPKVDICDTHAKADLYGLGKGVYPHGKNPWPAHPNTLSYVVAVFDETAINTDDTMVAMDHRDETTRRYFNQQNNTLDFKDDAAADAFDAGSDADLIMRLTGAPDGSEISIQRNTALGDGFLFSVKNDALFEYPAEYVMYQDASDELLYVFNEGPFIRQEMQQQGIGTRSIIHQIYAAESIGVSAIRLDAAGRSGSLLKGYYVWPQMGFDAEIPAKLKAQLPDHLSGSERLSDLFTTEAGRDWWYDNGSDIENAQFDLSPGSRSWELLNQYMKAKEIRI